MKIRNLLVMMFILTACAACSKDDDNQPRVPLSGTVKVDATDYGKWTYVSFKDDKQVTYAITDKVDETSFDWDIAIHRFDVRTNGGAVLATDKTDMSQVTDIPASGYTADIDGTVLNSFAMPPTDDSYTACKLSGILNTWITRAGMPPTYTLSNLVYIVQCKDNTYAKVKFTDYSNDEGKTGHVGLTYEYLVK